MSNQLYVQVKIDLSTEIMTGKFVYKIEIIPIEIFADLLHKQSFGPVLRDQKEFSHEIHAFLHEHEGNKKAREMLTSEACAFSWEWEECMNYVVYMNFGNPSFYLKYFFSSYHFSSSVWWIGKIIIASTKIHKLWMIYNGKHQGYEYSPKISSVCYVIYLIS